MGKRSAATVNKKRAGSEWGSSLILALALFAFWLVLSGKFEVKYITIGLFAALGAAIVTQPLLSLPYGGDRGSLRSAYDMPYLKLLGYFP